MTYHGVCSKRLGTLASLLVATKNKLGMQYATKLNAYLSNPAYDCVFNPLYENVIEKQPNTIQSFGFRIKSYSDNYDIDLDDILLKESSFEVEQDRTDKW
jgi:hypothetical protein